MKKYFSYSDRYGFNTHDTHQEARDNSQANLDTCREQGLSDGWGEDVEQTCFGIVLQSAVFDENKDAVEFYDNYDLKPV